MAEKNTVKKDQKEKVEGMQEAAEVEDAGGRPGSVVDAPVPPPGKGDVRLFEVSPGNKLWLSESEATARGFFWRPDKPTPKK